MGNTLLPPICKQGLSPAGNRAWLGFAHGPHLQEGEAGISGQVGELQVTLHHLTALVEVAEHVQVGLGTGQRPQLHVCAGAHWQEREDGSEGTAQ